MNLLLRGFNEFLEVKEPFGALGMFAEFSVGRTREEGGRRMQLGFFIFLCAASSSAPSAIHGKSKPDGQ